MSDETLYDQKAVELAQNLKPILPNLKNTNSETMAGAPKA
jgi:hypothetical protein